MAAVYAAAVIDDWATVRADAQKLIERFPQSADMQVALAVGLEGMGEHEAAVTALRKAVELNPKHLTGWLMLVQMNYRLNRLEDAALALEQARSIAPDNVDILMSLAKAYVRLGDADRATLVLAGATKAAPANVEAWVNYLAVSARTNRSDAAWREFDQLRAARPRLPPRSRSGCQPASPVRRSSRTGAGGRGRPSSAHRRRRPEPGYLDGPGA